MNIGIQIQTLRRKRNITQETLAAEMGVTVGAVSKWENSATMPDILMLCSLADYFHVTTDELLGRSHKGSFVVCDDAAFIRDTIAADFKKRFLFQKRNRFFITISRESAPQEPTLFPQLLCRSPQDSYRQPEPCSGVRRRHRLRARQFL